MSGASGHELNGNGALWWVSQFKAYFPCVGKFMGVLWLLGHFPPEITKSPANFGFCFRMEKVAMEARPSRKLIPILVTSSTEALESEFGAGSGVSQAQSAARFSKLCPLHHQLTTMLIPRRKFFYAHNLLGTSTIKGLNIKNTPVQCFSIDSSTGLTISDVTFDNSAGASLGHNTDAYDM